jgi:hypothetical protein
MSVAQDRRMTYYFFAVVIGMLGFVYVKRRRRRKETDTRAMAS